MTESAQNLAAPIVATFVGRHLKHIAVTLFSLVALLASVFLYSRNNDFSSFFHTDEPGKATQLVTNKRLYLHPQLLLETTDLALKLFRDRSKENLEEGRDLILMGRRVSAIFAALCVVALGLVGYYYAGLRGLVLGALSVALCPSLLINAHYMKEETALVFGIALTLLAALIYSKAVSRRSHAFALVFLGVAAGIAVSGKYIGIIALPAALLFVSFTTPWRRIPSCWGAVLVACATTAALINYRIFAHWSSFRSGLNYDLNDIVAHHFDGTTMNRPNLFLAKALIRETMPHVLVFAGAYLISLAWFWKRTSRWDLFFVLFVGFSVVLLSFSIAPIYRYNLLIIVMLHLMAALGVVRLAGFFPTPVGWIVMILALALMVPLQLQRCVNYLDQFANDSRVRLRRFVAHNLPADSAMLADQYALPKYDDDPHLAEDERELPIKLYSNFWAADYGELQSLPGLGFNYVAVSELAYWRFFDPEVLPAPNDWHYAARRRFYEQLFATGELVWSSTPDPPSFSFVNPALRLYRLPAH
jgi:4-amino-4-deoxy-L-arabinose transferase-like glycosyltransferase